MRDYSRTSPRYWIGTTGRQIKAKSRDALLLGNYLLSSPNHNMLGLYYLPKSTICHELGFTPNEVESALAVLIEVGFCKYDTETEHVWVLEMAFYQIGDEIPVPEPGKKLDGKAGMVANELLSMRAVPFVADFVAKYSEPYKLRLCPQWPELEKAASTPPRRGVSGKKRPPRRPLDAPSTGRIADEKAPSDAPSTGLARTRARDCDSESNGDCKSESPSNPAGADAPPSPPPDRKNPDGWLTPYAIIWQERMGIFHFAKHAKALRAVERELGAEEALRRWQLYCAETDPQYANSARFSETHRRYEHGTQRPGKSTARASQPQASGPPREPSPGGGDAGTGEAPDRYANLERKRSPVVAAGT